MHNPLKVLNGFTYTMHMYCKIFTDANRVRGAAGVVTFLGIPSILPFKSLYLNKFRGWAFLNFMQNLQEYNIDGYNLRDKSTF